MHLSTHLKRTASALLFVSVASIASAQLTFSVTGTITSNSSTAAYQNGDTISISFTTTAAGTTEGYADSVSYFWDDYNGAPTPIVDSFSFTGASGTYVRPAAGSQVYLSAYSDYFSTGLPGFDMFISVNRTVGVEAVSGLLVGGLEFGSISMQGSWSAPIISGSSLENSNAFFGGYSGAPIAINGTGMIIVDLPGSGTENDGEINFSFSELTITAVPEPSSYAALMGVVSLAGVLGARRRRR